MKMYFSFFTLPLFFFKFFIFKFFFVRHSEFENFLLCERILINHHLLSKRKVKLILKILSDLEPLRGLSNKKTLYSSRSCVNWAFLALVGL
jgi:hypothetical protein